MYLWHVFMAYYIYNLFIKELHAFLLLAFTQELLAELHLFSHHAEVFDDQHLVAPHWKIKLMYLHAHRIKTFFTEICSLPLPEPLT